MQLARLASQLEPAHYTNEQKMLLGSFVNRNELIRVEPSQLRVERANESRAFRPALLAARTPIV